MKPRPPYVEFVIEQFSQLGTPTARAMMGGWVLYIDGFICALIANNELYLKGDEHNIPEFESRGLKPFQPFEDPKMVMKYYQAPPEIFEDPDALKHWVGSAVEAGRRAAKKPARKKQLASKKGR